MNWRNSSLYLLPIALGLLGLVLLARVLTAETPLLIPEDFDVLLLVSLLGVSMVIAIHTIVRLSMNYLRQLSIQRARRDTFSEHQRFLQRLDHELKNPLTALRAGLQTLSLTSLDHRQQQILDTMQTETQRLSRLVADLRKLADLEAQPLDLQPVDVESLVAEVIQMMRERFEAGQRTLTSEGPAQPTIWLLDTDLLSLALHNLLDNAFKYTQPGDAVTVTVAARQDLTIQVRDTGIGIPEQALPHIWEELYRAEQVEKIMGSGIGLTLVKAIVERHDGWVQIKSTQGQGTTVTLTIPALSPLPDANAANVSIL